MRYQPLTRRSVAGAAEKAVNFERKKVVMVSEVGVFATQERVALILSFRAHALGVATKPFCIKPTRHSRKLAWTTCQTPYGLWFTANFLKPHVCGVALPRARAT